MMTHAQYWLPLFFLTVMGLALLIYVVLDGYDLGVGILLPFATDDEKDIMISSIGPFWDANETWLVLGVGVLLMAFPMAHGIILSALYLPVTVMLIALVLRGVAFDFRVKVQAKDKALWNRLFAIGSTVAALAQGWMLGSYVTGFTSEWYSILFNAVTSLALPSIYVLLGSGWLLMKSDGELQAKAMRWGRAIFWLVVLGLGFISVTTPLIRDSIFNKWFSMPDFLLLMPIPVLSALALWAAWHVLNSNSVVQAGYGWVAFVSTAMVCIMAFFGLAFSQFPFVIIDKMTVWQAASATDSLWVSFIGCALTLPVIFGYTVFSYRVFWGKANMLSYK
jgi:cytochrome bd ubiquinol oxidase subunit II